MPFQKIQALFHPEQYHGWGKTRKFFEGWYYKIVSADERKAFAVIPGIAMDKSGEQQGFIQILDGKKLSAEYHRFDVADFCPKAGCFELQLGDNFFSATKLQLDLPTIKGELNFTEQAPWPSSLISPNIMGPFTFVPFMECYHGILSMDHNIQGQLNIHKKAINFNNGRGYMEKDWGASFPSAYIWLQSNHFSQKGLSIKASVARIPWLGGSFVGFIAGLLIEDRLIQFTTYNFSKLVRSHADKLQVQLAMENSQYRLDIFVQRDTKTVLAAPISGFMNGRIEESMTSRIEVRLIDRRNKKIIFHDTGRNGALEVAGNLEEILITEKDLVKHTSLQPQPSFQRSSYAGSLSEKARLEAL
mgnify:FL=1